MENHESIDSFQSNGSVIYERLEPVYTVLNHIYDILVEEKEIDDDLDIIFRAGFSYLHSQFEIIKIYFETLFEKQCDDFVNYSEMVLCLPTRPASMNSLLANAVNLKPVITSSLAIIITTIQAGINFISTNAKKAARVRILSARGSINLPKFVTSPLLLAKYPSR